MAKKKKNDALMQAAQTRVKNAAPQETSLGITQAQVDAVVNRRREATQNRQASRAAAAPVQTSSASDRLSAVARDRVSYETTGHSTYFDDQPRASERLRNNSSSASYANDRAPRFDYGRNDTQLRRRSNQGAGKLKTTYEGGTARYQYERDPRNDSLNASYSHMAAENGTWQQRRNSPLMGKLTDKLGVDRSSQYMTQETDRTVKYDDGRKTEYFVVDGKGDDARLISVPEERYFQQQQLDGGLNPETMTPYKRLQGAAEHGIKNALHGLKSTYGSIQSNKNDQQRAKEYAETHPNGNNLNRRRDMLMGSYGAAGAVRGGDDVKANEYVNQEAMEDIMREREQLEQQKKLDEMYQAYKAGASKPMQLAMDVTDTTANMAPGMLSNFILPGSFIPEMAVQSYGSSYNQARNNGASHDEAVLSGLQNAAVESLSEMMFAGGKTLGKLTGVRGIFRPGKEIEEASLGFIRSTAGKDVVRTVQKLGLAGAEEGAEELVAGIVEPLLDNLIYQHEDINSEWIQNMLHDAAYNALVGFASGGGFGTVDVAQSIRQGADIRAHADVANMINQGLAMPENTKAYSLARSLDNQIKAGQSLGNLDVSDLNNAVREQQAEIQKKYQHEAKTTDETIENNRLLHRSESAQAAYERAMESEEEAEQAIAEGASEQEAADRRAGMSAQGAEYGEHLRNARAVLAKHLMPAMTEEASEDPNVVEATRAGAEKQAEDGANTIARVMMGEATVEDFQKFSTTNPALREAYEEIAGVSIPEGNEATVDFMINQNEVHYIAEQRNDKSRALLAYADAVFGDNTGASQAFRKSMGDLSNVDANELEGMIRGFSDAYAIGRASEPNATLPRRTDMMQFLTDDQINAAFEAGKADRRARSEMVKAAEKKIAAAKKSGKRKPKLDHDVASNLNEKERGSEKAKKAIEDMQILQDALNVKITLETARTTADSGNPESSEGWYDKDGIHLNIDADTKVKPLEVVFSHEFTHHLQRYAPKEYQALVEFVIKAKTDNDMQAWERMVEQKMVDYGNAGVQLTRDQAIDEIVADMAYEFLNNEQTVERLFAYDATLAEKIKGVMLNMIDKILKFFKTHGSQWKGMEADLNKARQMWLDAAEAARENAGLDLGESEGKDGKQYSVGKTTDNRLVVVVNDAVRSDLPESQYIKEVKDIFSRYKRIPVYGQVIGITNRDEGEMVASRAARALKKKYSERYVDKMSAIAHPFDILYAATNWVNEGPDHQRTDDIVDFGRGKVLLLVDGRKYKASVVVAYTTYNTMELYDVVGVKPADFEIKKEARVSDKSARTLSASTDNIPRQKQSRNQNTQKEQDAVDFENNVVDSDKQFSISESQMDPGLVKRLNNEKKVKVYRAMQYIDGRLYPPMAAVVKGDLNGGTELGKWEQAEERPDLVVNENGKEYFVLNKGNGKSIKARYNPYIHTSLSPLNDQFSSAYARPNMVVVEGYVPESELTSGYKAEKAKDSVGETQWKAGPVAGKLGKIGKPRRVILSRYFKPERVIPDTEVAGMIADIMDGTGISIPANVVTPSLRAELEAAGVEIDYENVPKAFKDSQVQFSLAEDSTGRQLTKGQQEYFKDSKIRDEQGRLKVMYHGTNNEFTVFDFSQGGKNGTAEGYGIYTSDREDVSRHYGGRLIEGYVNITRPAASDQKTIKRSELKKLIKATVDAEAQRLAEDYDGDVAAAAKDTWISNYTYTYDKSLDAAIDEVAGTILDLNDNDMDIVQEVMGGMAIRDYNEAEQFYDVLTDVTGIDGFVTDWEDRNTGESSRIALAFRSDQIKNVTNESPTEDPDIRYSISTPMSELDHTDKTVADSNGNPVAKFDRAGGVQFSISTYEDKGRAVLNKYLDKMVLEGEMDQDEADQIRTEMEKIYDVCKDYADTGRYLPFTAWSNAEVITGANGRPIFSAVKNNSEYKMNMDFSTICKKRRTLDAIFNELVNRGFFDRFDLNKEDSAAFVVKMNDIIRKNGFEAACALCFVEARRYRQQQTAMTFRDMWNDLVKSMYKDESKISHFNFGQDNTARMVEDGIHTMKDSDLDLTYLKKVAKSKGVPSRAAKLLLEDPSQRKLMRTGDMMSSVGFENFQVQNPKLMKIYNAKKGTGGAKSSFGDVQYFHEIIGSRNKTFSRNKAYKVGGVRIQSFSDYVPRMVFDYVEMVADLAAKRLPAHAYTKEALFAKQFGLTGIKINLSLVPDVVKGGKAVGLDKNGNYVWNVEGTFPYDEAEKLIHAEGYKENVGTIAVGVSDEQIRKMLADPNIMMVIPYHKSSLNPIVAEMTNVDAFTDYTDFQNTKDEEGKAVKRDFDWDGKLHKLSHGKDGKLLPKEQWGDIQSVVKEYADWCKARNYTPKFSQFLYMEDGSINPGYYKMLEDFSLLTVDGEFTPQDDVRMKFPTENDAFGSMADLIAEGLDADAVLEGKRSKKVAPIADEIEALAESGGLLSDLNQRDVDVVKNFMETTDVTKGHQPQFSLASDRDREIANLQSKVERLQRDKRRTYGREASDADARRVARALLADTSSDFSLNQTIKAVKELFTMIKRGDDFADIYGYVQGIARSVADSSYDMVEIPGASDLADLRQRFLDARKSQGGSPLKILIPQNLIGDFDRVGGWKEFRAAHKGIVTLSVNSGESYDSFIDGIADEFGEQFNVEGDNSGIDTLIAIIEAADSQEARNPVRKAYKDEDVEGVMPDDVDMGIMGGYRDTEVNEIIDRLLDDVAEQIAPDLTFADKKAAEKDAAVKKERAKWEARREQWRKDRDKRIAEMKEDKKLAVEAQRAKGKERLQKQAELYRRQREKARERRADTASRRKTLDRIYKTTQRLSQKLLKPTDSQHIPEKYRAAVAEMLGWLDFENARTDKWARKHGNVPSERILNLRKLREIYAGIASDKELFDYIEPDDQVYEWMQMLEDLDGSRLATLDAEQLRTVRLVLDAVSWQVNNADKALTEGLKQSRADMATELMDELEAQKGEKLKDGVIKKFLKSDATPVHFFDRLGLNVFKKLYQQLTLAQDIHIKHLSEAQEYIEKNITSKWGNTAKIGNNSLIKKWTEESEKYELENGKTVEMTGAQVMSLYALNKREQARKHLLGGGIVIAPTKVKRTLKGGVKEYLLNRELQKTRSELTYKDITSILSKMSKEQIDAAEAMLKYLKTTSEWGNETSMKLYGYRKFTEDNYFPIQSAKEFIAGSNLELQRDKKIKNQGMTKNVNEYANNPLVIDDFFEVTTAHINQMSQYNSFVPILEDFDRIYQYREYDPKKQKYHRSVKELIEQKHGRWAADYIETLLKNVNGNYGSEVADIQGFEKLLRNWKAAKIGLSIRVLAQQPTAVVRAFNEIDPKYFVGTPKRGSHKRMWEICPIAEWKHWGYSQTDIHRSMRDTMMGDKHLSDKLFFDMYGKADDLGWGAIFDAVERETKDLMKKGKLKFEYDSAEYRQHVNERFRHIVDRTQVVDSVLHRSQLMRSQNTLTKAMTAFMAEPTISVNTIMTAFTKAQEEARAGHKAAAAKAASRGVGVFVANAVAVSLMASLISAIRESYLPDDDDDDEEKELSRLQQMMVNMGFEEGSFMYDWISGYFIEDFKDNINPLMMLPVTKDMLNMLQGYEAPNPMYQLPQSLIQNAQNMKKWIDEDGDTRYSGRYYIERAAESVAELFGVPAANIRKELIGIQNIYFRAISEKEYGDYLQDRWELNEDYKSNKNIFIDHYLNAKKAGHDESAKDIREQLLKSKARDDEGNLVFTDEAIQKRAWSVYAPNFKDDVIAGRDVSKQEKDLKSVGITAEDIDDKKSKALVSSISDAVEMGDTNRLEDLYGVLEKYGYGEYDVDKKVKSAASDLMYDAIDAENYDEADRYINVITDVTGYTRDDVVSSITTHYMSSYYEAMDAGDSAGVNRVTSILGKYGVSSNTIREKEAEHYKDYYRQKAYMAYSSGNTAEAYRIATEYNQKYPGVYSKGVDGMIYGIQNLSDDTIRRYTTSGKYDEWQLP